MVYSRGEMQYLAWSSRLAPLLKGSPSCQERFPLSVQVGARLSRALGQLVLAVPPQPQQVVSKAETVPGRPGEVRQVRPT